MSDTCRNTEGSRFIVQDPGCGDLCCDLESSHRPRLLPAPQTAKVLPILVTVPIRPISKGNERLAGSCAEAALLNEVKIPRLGRKRGMRRRMGRCGADGGGGRGRRRRTEARPCDQARKKTRGLEESRLLRLERTPSERASLCFV